MPKTRSTPSSLKNQPSPNQPFQRPQFQLLLERLQEKPRFIQILAGPRQVGKTTLVQQVASTLGDRVLYAAADLPTAPTAQWIEQQWARALALMHSSGSTEGNKTPQPFVLILDEIQKIPRWSETVKALWDQRGRAKGQDLHLVLLGSSQFLVQQGLTESLAGRFELIRLPHWSFTEMQSAFGFSLNDYICFGGYPGPAGLIKTPERWIRYMQDAIVEPTVSRDVMNLARIDKPALMRSLMQLGCAYSGQMLSYQKVMGQLQDAGNTTTLANYLHLLASAWMVTGLQKYAGDQARSRSSSPKFQVFDVALQSSQVEDAIGLAGPTAAGEHPETWGRLVESTVGAHLLNTANPSMQITYWRDRNKEVDFVVSQQNRLLALEVKSGRKTRAPSGLVEFQKQFPRAKLLLVGTGGLPLQEFLSRSAAAWFEDFTQKRTSS
ncbi:MAG: ATP-binding protein [Burkholderiaceae bacterium]